MAPDTKYTDLTKAVMTDESGKWHLVPAEHVNSFASFGRNSIIVHQCEQWAPGIRSPIKNLPYEPLGYWGAPKHIQAPCRLCEQRVPEAIANLFMLHNFDTFASDRVFDIGAAIYRAVTRVGTHFEHEVFISDGPCPCGDCIETYGAWK